MEVERTPFPAANDCYGKLFCYLFGVFKQLLERLCKLETGFQLGSTDVRDLSNLLDKDTKFTRIEVGENAPTETLAQMADVEVIGIEHLGHVLHWDL